MGDSFCKLIYDVKKCQLVGVHIIGSYASEMMYGAAAMAYSKLPTTSQHRQMPWQSGDTPKAAGGRSWIRMK